MAIVATFQPQVWVNDHAMNVDPQHDDDVQEWDVTDAIEVLGKEAALALKDDTYETDELRTLPNAPDWVKEWPGPFYVMVEDAIRQHYGENSGSS